MKRRVKEDCVCNFPGDFTKPTSYSELSIQADVFVHGSHGVNAILVEPAFQIDVLHGEVVLVDSLCVCVCVCVCVSVRACSDLVLKYVLNYPITTGWL